ncbi:hypothetical protein ROE7235_00849 [Roseibaca ekhonensis]|jgi:hypothetical protein|uniref:Uncharacterized protein n=1 Tax=Roseinatronobacter ekhonensis TaxID=254356 RepID=A0A3B0MQC8_9RHOB|nr:hypothetical protein [Roseibaca ekhonensis]SUZ31114.1 hypothetical protein ROE7235_00849 [Roseibaca ekhonensis]
MEQYVRGIYREETYPLPRGRITAIVTPDGAATRLELFSNGLVATRPMRDFAQAARCAKDIAQVAWGRADDV